MKIQAAIIVLISLILTACNQNKPAADRIPVVGEAVDSAAIAEDTLNQKSLEESYEYAQTVIVNPKLVYDVRAYGGPASHGEYAILRRGADNIVDTVVMAERFGTIENAFTADLNHNGNEEIYVVFRKPNKYTCVNITGFEFDKTGAKIAIDFGSPSEYITINLQEAKDSVKFNIDSIYLSGDRIIRTGLSEKIGDSKVYWNRLYKLEGTKLVFDHGIGTRASNK